MNIIDENWEFEGKDIVYKTETPYGPRIQGTLQLVYVFRGYVDIFIDNQEPYRLSANEMTLLVPGRREFFRFADGTHHGWVNATLGIYPEQLLRKISSAPKTLPFTEDLAHIDKLARDTYQRGSAASDECRSKLMASLYCMYFEAAGITLGGQEPVFHPALQKAEAFMRRQLIAPITLEDIARKARITPTHLIRLYKEQFNQTPIRRLWELRLELAANLMKETGLTAAEVAERCGFSNPQHFSKAFHKHFGQTPRQMRLAAWN